MKKLFMIGMMLLLSTATWSKCVGIELTEFPQKCLELKRDCPKGTIYEVQEKDGKYIPTCVPCESKEVISIIPNCTSVEKVRTTCPNRYISYGCGVASVLKCSDYKIVDEKSRTCTDPPDIMY